MPNGLPYHPRFFGDIVPALWGKPRVFQGTRCQAGRDAADLTEVI